jgi:hypothetical protein
VPADHAAAVAEALLHLYQAKAESLQQRVNDLIRDEASPGSVIETRDQLQALDQALEYLGWDARSSDRAVEVTASRSVLREATMVAIDDAGERLSGICTALVRGEATIADVNAQLESVRGLLDLLRAADGDRLTEAQAKRSIA